MDFFLGNILYIALTITILFTFILYVKYNRNKITVRQSSETDIELRLRAYERLAVFLDRIEPIGMISRLELHDLNQDIVKSSLIKNIIIEYEYNISQQIYVSDSLWELIDTVKNQIINHISAVSESLPKQANTDDFVTLLLKSKRNNGLIIKQIQKTLKKEVRGIS
tara:strand:+ start:946 stop:1443 length:498 start_codon:yes stop_codon:yes gene_type:complete